MAGAGWGHEATLPGWGRPGAPYLGRRPAPGYRSWARRAPARWGGGGAAWRRVRHHHSSSCNNLPAKVAHIQRYVSILFVMKRLIGSKFTTGTSYSWI